MWKFPWDLTLLQWEIFRSKARYLVLVAGRRFGKTVLAIAWLICEVMRRKPGSLAYYVAPYRVMAKQIAWQLLIESTKGLRVGKPNISELTVTLPGNRRISLKGADDPETLEGVGLVAVVLDEFARMKLAAYEQSLRPTLSDNDGRVFFCGKPRGANHLKDFYEKGVGALCQVDWKSWLYTTAQGGFVPASDIAEAKRDLPTRVYNQEYESTFESLAGRVYDGFTRRLCVAPHAEIEREYCDPYTGRWRFKRIVIGIDWGLVNPGVMLVCGETGTGRIVVIHEEYWTDIIVSELGWIRIAKQLRTDFGPIERMVADPSEPGNIRALSLGMAGKPVIENAINEVAEGIRRVQIALLPRQDRKPGLIISDACVNTIREIESYVWREVSGVTIEEPEKKNDHAMDALRYAIAAMKKFS